MPMGQAIVDEATFIETRKKLMSDTATAKALGMSVQNVTARARRLERKHGIRFLTHDPRRPQYDTSMLVTADRVEVKLTLRDGVILVSGDQHFFPGHVPTMHRAYCLLAKKLKPFACIWNGDAFDGATISRHPSIGWEDKPAVSEELECVKERAHEVMRAAPSAKRIWCAGNHDLRFESRIAMYAPEFRNVQGMHLKDHIPEFLPAWFVTVNGGTDSHTEIRHREKGGVHAAYNNAVSSGITLVTGHDHRADVVSYDDRRGRRYGVRHGMGADSARDAPFVHYLEGRTPSWQSGLAVLTYKDGVLLYPELALRMSEDSFQFRGEIIKC